VTDNHQEKNARVLSGNGGAVLVLEKECTARLLYDKIKELLADNAARDAMSAALKNLVVLDSAERIGDILEELTKNKS